VASKSTNFYHFMILKQAKSWKFLDFKQFLTIAVEKAPKTSQFTKHHKSKHCNTRSSHYKRSLSQSPHQRWEISVQMLYYQSQGQGGPKLSYLLLEVQISQLKSSFWQGKPIKYIWLTWTPLNSWNAGDSGLDGCTIHYSQVPWITHPYSSLQHNTRLRSN